MPSHPARFRRVLIWSLSLALFGSLFLPVAVAPPSSRHSAWDWVRNWFIGQALADGKDVPKQQSGNAGTPQGQVPADATDASGGKGRALGKGKGELGAYEAPAVRTEATQAGRATPSSESGAFDAATSTRVAAESTETTDVYANADGSRTAMLHQGPANYRDANGVWQPIQTTLVGDAGEPLTPKAHGLDIEIGRSADDASLVSVAVDDEHSVSFGMDGAADVPAKVEKDRAVFSGVRNRVDLVEQPLTNGVKETIVLRSADAGTSWAFPLKLKGLTAKQSDDGSVELRNKAGKLTAEIPAGYARDSATDGAAGPAETGVRYDLDTSGKRPVLKISLDNDWLTDPARVFPVYVDPTVATLSSWGYYETNPVKSHTDELRMGFWDDDGKNHVARSYLAFKDFATTFANQRVTAASLTTFAIWSAPDGCASTTTFDVKKVTSSWSASTLASPGPTLSTKVGTWSGKSPAASCTNHTLSNTVGGNVTTAFNADGVAMLNNWIYAPTTNFGLAMTTSETNSNYWKIFANGSVAGHQPTLSVTYTPNVAPQVDSQYPYSNYSVQTLTPELLAYGHDADAFPNAAVTYNFTVYDEAGTTAIVSSGDIATPHWTVPAGKLAWGKHYRWAATTKDGKATSANPQKFVLNVSVPQPALTSELSSNTDEHGFEPNAGNYTNDDSDIDISTVGPSLSVDRSYNSNDPRSAGVFGAGWSSLYDAKAVVTKDGAGAEVGVLVTYPDGSEVGFGRNADGSYSPAPGRYSQFSSLGAGAGFKLVDKSATTYSFGKALGNGSYALDKISDASGRTETFGYDASNRLQKATSASGRSLTFGWSTPPGAANAHVTTVSSDPLGSSGPVVWTYGYSGDKLGTVCAPTSATKCTTYSYGTSNLYPQTVLDQEPSSYWRFGEATGATRAKSAILANAGTDDATYAGVTLGGAASLDGSTATTATFNGTSSNVKLLNRLALGASFQTLSLRFKASGPNGVLFSYQRDPITKGTTTSDYTPSLYVGADGKLLGKFWGGSGMMQSSASVVDGKWHDVAMVAMGDSQALYLDGAKIGTLAGQVKLYSGSSLSNVYVGGGFIGGTWPNNKNNGLAPTPLYFKGSISDVAFFDRSLNTDEIAALKARVAAVPQLTTITRPTGSTFATVSYDTAAGRVAKVIDDNGGAWTIKPSSVSGSSQVFASSVLGAAPDDYWRLSDAAGPDVANEVNGDLLTHVGGVTVATVGRFADSKVATYNGTTGYSNFVTDTANPTATPIGAGGNQSVGLWFKTATPNGVLAAYNAAALSAGTSATSYVPMLYIGSDGKLRGEYWDGATTPITTSAAVTNNAWHHVVLSAGATNQSMYLDGVLVGTKNGTVALPSGGAPHFQLGGGFLSNGWPAVTGKTSGTATFFKGSIGDVATYSTALSLAQVQAQWAAAAQSDGKAAVSTSAVTDPGGKTASYVYDLMMGSRTLLERDTLGNETQYGYDTGGFLYTVTDPNGNVVTSGHDVRGNTVSTKSCQDFSASKCSTVYYSYFPDDTTANPPADPRNDLITAVRDGRSASATDDTFKTSYSYDAVGNQTKETSPAVPGFPSGRTTETTYTTSATAAVGGGTTPAGLVATLTTPAGRVTTFGYASNGDLVKQTDPSGLITTYGYDDLGRVSETKEISDTFSSGLVTKYEYDAVDQVVKETEPASKNVITGVTHTPVTATTFDESGNILSQTVSDATGNDPARTVSSTYDAHDQQSSTTDALGNKTTFGYDAYGNRTAQTDPTGVTTAFSFDAEGRLLDTVLKGYTGDPNAPTAPVDLKLSSRSYDPAGRLAYIQDSMNNRTSYAYTDDGQVATITRSNGTSTFVAQKNSYDGAGNVIAEVTNNGATTTTTTVDAAGRDASMVLDPGGLNRTTSNSYDGDDLITKTVIGNAAGSQTTASVFDDNGMETKRTVTGSVAPGDALTTLWKRDNRGLVTQVTDPMGKSTDYVNDEAEQVVSITSPQTSVETNGVPSALVRPAATMGYDTFGEQTHVRDANGNLKTTGFDADGRPVTDTAPAYTAPGTSTAISPVTTTEYDALDQVTATVDATGARTTYGYDQLGDVVTQVNPDGGKSTYSFDTAGDQLSVTDPMGAVTSATYDFLGRQVTETDQLKTPSVRNLTTTSAYSTAGWLSKTTSPSGVVSSQTMNPAGEVVTATDGAGNTTSYGYDYSGQVTSVTNPDSTKTVVSYDDAGNALKSTDYDASGTALRSSTTEYDANGRVTKTTDPRGGVARFGYDSRGLVTSESQKIDDASTIETTLGYDAAGNRTRFTDGRGNEFWTTYNSWNLPDAQIEPATTAYPNLTDRTFSVSYDANGQVVSSRAPGNVVVSNSYDSMGRLTAASGTGAEVATTARTFAYDKSGRMTSAAAGAVTEAFSYDERDDLLSAKGASGDSSFNYADDGQLITRTDAAGLTKYRYDSAGRLSSVDDPATGGTVNLTYRSMNLVDSISYGSNANKRTFSYDALHRLTSDTMKTSGGASIASIGYGYDANDNLTSKTTTGLAGAASNTYSYDLANRLTSWDDGSKKTSYGYDASGNRTSAGPVTYTYDARNELLSDGTKTYAYSPRGTQSKVTTTAGASPIAFDAFGQTVSQGELGYSYDALGRMISAKNGAQQTTLSYSGAGNTIVNDGTSTYTRDPGDGLLAVGSSVAGAQTPMLVWTDQHDDVVGEFAASGATVGKSVAYDPWGNLTTGKNLIGNLGFQSGWTDPESGRVDMLTRWYDPSEAQFTSRDRVSLSPVPASISANKFAYVDDNPLGGTDPTGECSWWDVVCGAKSVAHSVSNAYHATTNFVSHAWTATKHVVHHVVHKAKRIAHHVYHAARKAVHHVIHSVKRVVHHVVHKIRDGYHRVKHWASHTWHRVKQVASHVYHKVKHAVKRAVHHVSSAVHKTVGAVKHAIHKAGHAVSKAGSWVKHKASQAAAAVKHAAKATGNFLAKHAATITSVVVSVVVFAGCEAVVTAGSMGTLSAPGAIMCGALAGAAGSMAGAAVKAHQEGRELGAGELGQAALTGAIGGAVGGAAGPLVGKAISAVGGKLAGPVANVVGRAAGSGERALSSGGSAGERAAVRDVADDVGGAVCKLGHSFTPGTKVVLANGAAVAISSLKVGDKVRSVDPKTEKSTVRMVAKVHVNHDSDLLDLTVVRNGHRAVLHTTARHPFWSQSRKAWVRADQLGTTDELKTDRLKTDKTGVVRVARVVAVPGDEARWDLTVATDHDYYVVADTTAVLVHNCGTVPGPNSALRDVSTGRFAANPAKAAQQVASAGTHGNSRASTALTHLYRLENNDGQLLKWGVTSNLKGRYSARFLEDKAVVPMTSGTRDTMLNLERWVVENDPGPLNLEPWAGARR